MVDDAYRIFADNAADGMWVETIENIMWIYAVK